MKIGLIIGHFSPLHNGSVTLCKVATKLTEKLIIIIIESPKDPIPVQLRIKWLKKENPNAEVTKIFVENISFIEHKLKVLLANLSKRLGSNSFKLFTSDPFMSNIANTLKIGCVVLDPNRLAQNTNSKDILANVSLKWFDLPLSVRLSLIKRIVLIGPESVGKSTLANKLKSSLIKYPFLPEYGRPYEVFRDSGPYKDHEFQSIISVHRAHRTALLPFSGPIFIEDTDELMTAVWVEMLMGKILPRIEKQINLPFLYLLLDPSVPFVSEKTRYFNDEKRLDFFNKIKSKLDYYGASYVIIKGSWSERERQAKNLIKKFLNEKIKWSELTY